MVLRPRWNQRISAYWSVTDLYADVIVNSCADFDPAGAILGVCAALLWTASGFVQFAYPEEKDKAKVSAEVALVNYQHSDTTPVHHISMGPVFLGKHSWGAGRLRL